jgi:hypothetical protein
MLINSAMNEGLAGMQQSQKKMLHAAQQIARAGVPTGTNVVNPSATGTAPRSNAGVAVDDLTAANTVEAVDNDTRSTPSYSADRGDVVGALIEQKQQQLVFDASARVVGAANQNIGRLIDDIS